MAKGRLVQAPFFDVFRFPDLAPDQVSPNHAAQTSGDYRVAPSCKTYDIIIVGGAIMGTATAWFLSRDPDFDGRVLVVEKDPSYEFSSTMRANSSIRQQFSSELNVKISQFAADFILNMPDHMGNDPRVPRLDIKNIGYLYLADTSEKADALRQSQAIQIAAGAATRLLTPNEIRAAYPFYSLDDIHLGSINTLNEGYWDSATQFDWMRRTAIEAGVQYISDEVIAMTRAPTGHAVQSVALKSGGVVSCGKVVNASGPRARLTARMAGIEIPVEPRKRYTWVFKCETPLNCPLPLTIDPSGVHVRQDGTDYFLAGAKGLDDPAVDYDDFTMDYTLWDAHVWPILATRIPQFEAVRVTNEWAGHYAYNTFDHNALIGAHPQVENFYFLNGFSGHGLQQAPAMGRGTAELLVHGEYRSLDLAPFDIGRLDRGEPFLERAVI